MRARLARKLDKRVRIKRSVYAPDRPVHTPAREISEQRDGIHNFAIRHGVQKNGGYA